MNFDQLVSLCQETHAALHGRAARVVHATLAARNWLFGWYIVEFEQNGGDRAAYGAATLKSLAGVLKERLGKGFSVDALEQMRRFYLIYPSFAEPWMKSETLSRISGQPLISGTLSRKSPHPAPPDQPPAETGAADPMHAVSADWLSRFTLGWSQYVELITIDSPDERSFYEIEAAANQWSVRELQRQIASSLYERLALSRDKEEIRRLATEGQIVEKAADLIKNPLVLEFPGLEERPHYSEDELESAIIGKLESFLLELGKGFLFKVRLEQITQQLDGGTHA